MANREDEYKLSVDDLDKRICDCLGIEGTNTQTWREFILESEAEFGSKRLQFSDGKTEELDKMSHMSLYAYIRHLDYLWTK